MDYKEIQYPTPPAYDYLLEILEKKIQKFKPNHYDDEDLDKPSLSNEGTAIDIESSSVHVLSQDLDISTHLFNHLYFNSNFVFITNQYFYRVVR